MRAFTPRDQKAVKAAAEAFRPNPELDVESAIGELGVGEALVSFLDDKGTPMPVQRALIKPPHSRVGPASADERRQSIESSVLFGPYEKAVDRKSAYEILKAQVGQAADNDDYPGQGKPSPGGLDLADILLGRRRSGERGRESVLEAAANSAARSIGQEVGKQLIRGVLGSLLGDAGGRRRR